MALAATHPFDPMPSTLLPVLLAITEAAANALISAAVAARCRAITATPASTTPATQTQSTIANDNAHKLAEPTSCLEPRSAERGNAALASRLFTVRPRTLPLPSLRPSALQSR